MTAHRRYEVQVAEHFRELGYTAALSPGTNDYGLDVLAENDRERVAVQVKLYGGSARPVNRQMVMELCGVQRYFDCDRAVIVTDGKVRPDALEVARKLEIEFLHLPASSRVEMTSTSQKTSEHAEATSNLAARLSADQIWADYVMPLSGQTIVSAAGRTNKILSVDWSGIERVTSNDRKQKIKYEIFRLAINDLLTNGSITRDEINQNYVGRASSGIVLILSQVPMFRLERNPVRLVLEMAAGATKV